MDSRNAKFLSEQNKVGQKLRNLWNLTINDKRLELTWPRRLLDKSKDVSTVFSTTTWDKMAAVGSVISLAARFTSTSVEFRSKALQMAWPPSSPSRLSRMLRCVKVVFFVRAWAMACAPRARIRLSATLIFTSLLWPLMNFPSARAPRSPIVLWEKSSSIKLGWFKRWLMSTRHLSQSTRLLKFIEDLSN